VTAEPIDLGRFLAAHRDDFDRALSEIETGRKRSHWMWYIFPQVAGLGASSMSRRYAIVSLDEARAFLLDPTLGPNYERIVRAVWHQVVELGMTIHSIFGSPDDVKLVSSLTLFAGAARGSDIMREARPQMDDILRAAEREGLPRCATTERFLTHAH
jgi:uncharacterized protein (DUF1810 family)